MTTAEEWLIDYSLKTGHVVDINPDLISMSIRFDGTEVDAFILDVIDNKLVIQLALPIQTIFDATTNVYKNCYIRNLINSEEFLNRFNSEFVKHIQITEVHTEDYITNDKLWLLSHEEINRTPAFLIPNHECYAFEMFKTIDLAAYSRMLLKIDVYGWWLRSADGYRALINDNKIIGCVCADGSVYNNAYTDALCPACAIC